MKKILVIDDETITIHVIKFTLEDNPNLEIITATDGSKAIEFLENCAPDLVITDLVMPFKNGVDVVSYINQKYPTTPIIVISSLAANHSIVEEVKKLNISYFISKPLSAEVLNNCVIELLDNKSVSLHKSSNKLKKNFLEKKAKKNKKSDKKKLAKEDNKLSEVVEIKDDILPHEKSAKKLKKIEKKVNKNNQALKKSIKKLENKFLDKTLDENNAESILKKTTALIALHLELKTVLENIKNENKIN